MFRTIVILQALLALMTREQGYAYKDCGSYLSNNVSLLAPNCSNPIKRCVLEKNTEMMLTVEFTPKVSTEVVTSIVDAVMYIWTLPYSLPHLYFNQTVHYDIVAGSTYLWEIAVPIHEFYPKTTIDVKWKLKTKFDEDIFCITFPARIP